MPIGFDLNWSVVNKAYRKYMFDETRVQIYFGGSSSGKSWFLAQRCVLDVSRGGRNYLIVRKVAGTIRRSVFNEIVKCINAWKLKDQFTINQSDLVITCKNGYQILFCGCDDVEKLKSITPATGVLTDCWIEEATESEESDIKQLSKRLRGMSKYKKRIVLSFNPIMQTHWIYEKYFQGKWVEGSNTHVENGLSILKTTYKDNKFLTADDIAELENETDKYWYDVYTRGCWGFLGGVIFTQWREGMPKIGTWRCEEFDSNKFDSFLYGNDFGYSNDPNASNELHYDKKRRRLYICNEIHEHELTNRALAELLKPFAGSNYVTCDSSEPKSIQELNEYGICAIGAKKGKDSINFGIQWLRQLEIIIHPKCKHTKQEFESYKWKQDRSGKTLPVPSDKNNHHIDCIRYATEFEQGLILHEPMKEDKVTADYGNKYKRIDIGESGGWLSA